MIKRFARARTIVLALVMAAVIAVPLLFAAARPAAAYRGQVVDTWWMGLTHPNGWCHYRVFVYYGRAVRVYCAMQDQRGGTVVYATDYRSWYCWTPGGCYFEGDTPNWGWDWMPRQAVLMSDDDYGGQNGWFTNAWVP